MKSGFYSEKLRFAVWCLILIIPLLSLHALAADDSGDAPADLGSEDNSSREKSGPPPPPISDSTGIAPTEAAGGNYSSAASNWTGNRLLDLGARTRMQGATNSLAAAHAAYQLDKMSGKYNLSDAPKYDAAFKSFLNATAPLTPSPIAPPVHINVNTSSSSSSSAAAASAAAAVASTPSPSDGSVSLRRIPASDTVRGKGKNEDSVYASDAVVMLTGSKSNSAPNQNTGTFDGAGTAVAGAPAAARSLNDFTDMVKQAPNDGAAKARGKQGGQNEMLADAEAEMRRLGVDDNALVLVGNEGAGPVEGSLAGSEEVDATLEGKGSRRQTAHSEDASYSRHTVRALQAVSVLSKTVNELKEKERARNRQFAWAISLLGLAFLVLLVRLVKKSSSRKPQSI